MDFNLNEFIKPELLILIPVMYFIGMAFKSTTLLKDKYIPLALGAISVFLTVLYVLATSDISNYKDALMGIFVAFTQGILCAGASVYVNQLIVQTRKKDE